MTTTATRTYGTPLLAWLALCLATACGSGQPPPPDPDAFVRRDTQLQCGPHNCSGCCMGNTCTSGTTRSACGFGGLACVLCAGSEKCANRKCVPYSGKCDQFSCPAGCCKNNVCQPGTVNTACGNGGKQCKACPLDRKCLGGVCGSGNCNASNCNGCCSGSSCKPGTAASFCGKGGQGCRMCTSAEVCDKGACQKITAKCSTANCGGCCQNNKCHPGNTPGQCGAGGKQCISCPAGKTCVNGLCDTPPPKCTSATCAGCCDSGTCYPGGTITHCGKNGQQCAGCKSGEVCQAGACGVPRPSCGPHNCSGCCNGTSCASGSSASSCGLGGGQCASCKKYEICTSGSCGLDLFSKWVVTASSATLDTSKSWDVGFNTAPDPFVEVTLGSQTKKGTPKTDTYFPYWNQYMFTATANAILTMQMKVIVKDQDTSWDDIVGTCYISMSKSALLSGSRTVSNCDAKAYVKSLTFKYQAQ